MNPREISRRNFLKTLGTATAVGTLTAVGCGGSDKETRQDLPSSTNNTGIKPTIEKTPAKTPEAVAGVEWKIYHGEIFEIEFPKNWYSYDSSSGYGHYISLADVSFNIPGSNDADLNFRIVELDPDETTIEDHKTRKINEILYFHEDEIPGGEKGIQESRGPEFLGQPSLEFSYLRNYERYEEDSFQNKSSMDLIRMCVVGRNAIILTYTAYPDKFDQYKPIFEHMASSLALK